MADKWYPYQESIRVPLIVHDPRMPMHRNGQTIDALTLNVDLAPTIIAAAKQAVPPRMQGRNIGALYEDTLRPDWRYEFFYEHATIKNIDFIPASEALVRKDWKYIYWPDFKLEQLFDLRNDPLEENDLISDAKYGLVLGEMRKRFAELKAESR